MSAEHLSGETAQQPQSLGAESDSFARIEHLAHALGVTSTGAYFFKKFPDTSGVLQMLATSRKTDGTLFFACTQTAPAAHDTRSLKRTMDAFLVDPARKELAYLTPAYMFRSRHDNVWRGHKEQGPLVIDEEGIVAISGWGRSQLELQPQVFSPQPSRLEYEKSPVIFRAEMLARRLSSLAPEDKQERFVFPVGS